MNINKINNTDKLVSIQYDNMEHLLEREDHINQTLINLLNRKNNKQYIKDKYITLNDKGALLNFTLSENK